MDTRTLEQVISEASSSYDITKHGTRSQAIAAAVREWMKEQNDGLRSAVYDKLCVRMPVAYPSTDIQSITDAILSVIPPPRDEMFQAAIAVYESRIKELEAEVERLANLKSSPECCDKAAKYGALRERFPYLPGDEFWTYLQGAIRKWSVCEVWIGGEEILCKGVANGKQSPVYRMHECHHTADACRAAIPVEE